MWHCFGWWQCKPCHHWVQLYPLRNAQGHETLKIHLQVVPFSWFGTPNSIAFVRCGMPTLIVAFLGTWNNAWSNMCNSNLASTKEKILAFVKFVLFFTVQVFGNAGLKTMKKQIVPPMRNWTLLGQNHINFCLTSFIFAGSKWPLKHGPRIFEPISLEHFAYVELWIAKQTTWDLGHVLQCAKAWEKNWSILPSHDGGSMAIGTTQSLVILECWNWLCLDDEIHEGNPLEILRLRDLKRPHLPNEGIYHGNQMHACLSHWQEIQRILDYELHAGATPTIMAFPRFTTL